MAIKDEELSEIEGMDKIIKVALGEKAYKYIESLELTFPSYAVIVNLIMAAIGDVSLEEIEEEIKKTISQIRKSGMM